MFNLFTVLSLLRSNTEFGQIPSNSTFLQGLKIKVWFLFLPPIFKYSSLNFVELKVSRKNTAMIKQHGWGWVWGCGCHLGESVSPDRSILPVTDDINNKDDQDDNWGDDGTNVDNWDDRMIMMIEMMMIELMTEIMMIEMMKIGDNGLDMTITTFLLSFFF